MHRTAAAAAAAAAAGRAGSYRCDCRSLHRFQGNHSPTANSAVRAQLVGVPAAASAAAATLVMVTGRGSNVVAGAAAAWSPSRPQFKLVHQQQQVGVRCIVRQVPCNWIPPGQITLKLVCRQASLHTLHSHACEIIDDVVFILQAM